MEPALGVEPLENLSNAVSKLSQCFQTICAIRLDVEDPDRDLQQARDGLARVRVQADAWRESFHSRIATEIPGLILRAEPHVSAFLVEAAAILESVQPTEQGIEVLREALKLCGAELAKIGAAGDEIGKWTRALHQTLDSSLATMLKILSKKASSEAEVDRHFEKRGRLRPVPRPDDELEVGVAFPGFQQPRPVKREMRVEYDYGTMRDWGRAREAVNACAEVLPQVRSAAGGVTQAITDLGNALSVFNAKLRSVLKQVEGAASDRTWKTQDPDIQLEINLCQVPWDRLCAYARQMIASTASH